MTLSRSQQDALNDKKHNNQLSVYGFGKVTVEVFADCIADIKQSFPKLPAGWYNVLEKMLDDEGFTNERLIDATKALIRTCEFPEPTIARIIGFDRTVKVYTYYELLEHKKESSATERAEYLNSFGRINYFGELRFAKKDDIKKYNLPTWEKEN